MNSDEVVVSTLNRQRSHTVLYLLGERISQPGEAPVSHTDSQVLSLDEMATADGRNRDQAQCVLEIALNLVSGVSRSLYADYVRGARANQQRRLRNDRHVSQRVHRGFHTRLSECPEELPATDLAYPFIVSPIAL
jgi:hypothetical protein